MPEARAQRDVAARHAVIACDGYLGELEPELARRIMPIKNYIIATAPLGDERVRMLVYPSVWLFDADMKPLMQMPAGTGTFQTVPEQLEILHLVQ